MDSILLIAKWKLTYSNDFDFVFFSLNMRVKHSFLMDEPTRKEKKKSDVQILCPITESKFDHFT